MHNVAAVEEHVEDAAFHWVLRRASVKAPNYNLIDLAKLDAKVDAHLDGVLVAGDFGWERAVEAFDSGDIGEAFAVAALALMSGDRGRIERVIERAREDSMLLPGFVSAMGWCDWSDVRGWLEPLLTEHDPILQLVGIAAYGAHRQDPGAPLLAALRSDDARLRNRAILVSGDLGLVAGRSVLKGILREPDEDARTAAAWSLLLLDTSYDPALEHLRKAAESGSPWALPAAEMAARCGRVEASVSWLEQLIQREATRRTGLVGTGALGVPEMIPSLIAWMEDKDVGRLAGGAFTMITGVDLALEDLERDEPEDYEEDETIIDDDDDYPWPDPTLVTRWWNENSKDFKPKERYLAGKPMKPEALKYVLAHGSQPQRGAAALELARIRDAEPVYCTQKNGMKQARELLGWP